MELNVQEWKEFTLNRVFTLVGGFYNKKPEHSGVGNIPFLASTESNNGVTEYYSIDDIRAWNKIGEPDDTLDKKIFDENCIAVTVNGSVCNAFYQSKKFTCSHDITALYLKKHEMNVYEAQFFCTIIMQDKYRWNYGRKPHDVKKFGKSIFRFPIQHNEDGLPLIDENRIYSDEGYIPDWTFMEEYIKSLHYKTITTRVGYKKDISLNVQEWKEFTLNRVFTLVGGFYNKKPEHSEVGNIPFLASTESNNGVTEYYSIDDIRAWNKVGEPDDTLDKKIFDENCIVVTVNGSVCNAFYQSKKFTCSHDITALYLKKHEMNVYEAQFFCTIIMQDKYRWNYGRKPHDVKKFGKSIFRFPIQHNEDGLPLIDENRIYSDEGYIPDWTFMEEFIKILPYSDRI